MSKEIKESDHSGPAQHARTLKYWESLTDEQKAAFTEKASQEDKKHLSALLEHAVHKLVENVRVIKELEASVSKALGRDWRRYE
jgi:hypothetical protein